MANNNLIDILAALRAPGWGAEEEDVEEYVGQWLQANNNRKKEVEQDGEEEANSR